ncbi:unnamed protein product [Meloidogyne enterolobii]|uniref:Uncharacterized protein n=1 Tax=Meloidogyne enterolobii TaxID=390850 RepID=A0ACB1B0B1_MELEN
MSTITEASRAKSGISSRNIDCVGFANFPNQLLRRCVKDGFEFTMMSGLGKSTFLNTLFMAELHDLKNDKSLEIKSTVSIESKTFRLSENDVRLKITVVDTPGFGDFVDNSKCLKQLDIAFMKALQDRVNIIPVIAKADTLTPTELGRFKQHVFLYKFFKRFYFLKIMEDMNKNNISLYKLPDFDCEQQQSIVNGCSVLPTNGKSQSHQNTTKPESSKRFPFAIVGSTHVKEVLVGGEHRATKQRVRVREYPWGIVEVDNLGHNDFVALRDMIIRNNLIDLIEVTKCVHYENYRMRNLPQSSFDDDPFTQLERTIAKRAEMEDMRQKRDAQFSKTVAVREQRQMERTLSIDKEEKENQKVLEEKRELFDRIRLELKDKTSPKNIASNLLSALYTFRNKGK